MKRREIRLAAGPGSGLLHLLDGPDPADARLAWTCCRIRFAWGAVPRAYFALRHCDGCFA